MLVGFRGCRSTFKGWSRMRVLIFDATRGGGHTFNYHRLLLPALASLSNDVTVVASEDVLALPSTQLHLQSLPASIRWEGSVPTAAGSQVNQQLVARRALKAALRNHRPDHLYVPTADSLSQVLGCTALFDRREFHPGLESEAVVHRCGFAYPALSRSKQLLYQIGYWAHSRAPWTRLHNVDLIAYEWIQRQGGELARRNRFLPDPIEDWPEVDRHEARRRLGLADDGPWLGCVGAIDLRKGMDLLLAAFKAAALPTSARLLLGGQHHPYIRQLLETEYADLVRARRVVSLDRYLTVAEFGDVIAAMDLMCTPYARQIAIASIVLRAAAARRPVLATDFGWCGRVVPAFQLGWTCNVQNTGQFAQAIATRLEQAADWKRTPAAEKLVKFHSPQNFAATFTARLCERMGRPTLPGAISWNDLKQLMSEVDG
jgi:glycosyltransferase involved in cell wall biosynthesis